MGVPLEIDLSAETGVTTALIAHPLDWRVRAVEHLEIEAATSCLRRRSVQGAPLRPLLPTGLGEGATTALVVVNVASVPRGALLDLDIHGPNGAPAFLLPRPEIARREAAFLRSLASEAGLDVSEGLYLLLQGVLSYTKTYWDLNAEADLADRGADYLADGFGAAVPDAVMSRWLAQDKATAALLTPFSDAYPGLSPTGHPLLGLPVLVDTVDMSVPNWHEHVGTILTEYATLVEGAVAAAQGGPSAANDMLNSLADYGHNYDMLVATKVPLDEPFLIKYSERRHLNFSSNQGQQELVISDAGSNHVVLNVSDPNVRIKSVEALTMDLAATAFGAFTVRKTDQTYAVYAHGDDREYRVTLNFVLAPLRRLQNTMYFAAVLLLLLAAAVAYEQPRRLQDLALIAGPSALAASVLLNREPSTLGSRLRLRSTLAVSTALALLLLVATLSYLWPGLSELLSTFR